MLNLENLYSISEILLELIKEKYLSCKEAVHYVRKNFDREILNKYCIIGELSANNKCILGSKTSCVKFSMDSLLKNRISHPDLKFNDYRKIKIILNNYDDIVFDKKGNLRFFKNVNSKLYEIVIKTTKNNQENYLTTFHRCDESKLKNLKR